METWDAQGIVVRKDYIRLDDPALLGFATGISGLRARPDVTIRVSKLGMSSKSVRHTGISHSRALPLLTFECKKMHVLFNYTGVR